MRHTARPLALAASAVLALAASGGLALAQIQPPPPPALPALPPPPPPMPSMSPMMMGRDGMTMMPHGPHGDPAAHAQRLRDVLQLRPDQDAALKTYLEATSPMAMMGGMGGEGRAEAEADDAALTTPQRLDRQAAHMAAMSEAFQKHAAATRGFYATLSPSQRKAFDALGPQEGGPRMMMMMRRSQAGHGGMPMGEPGHPPKMAGKHKPG